MEFPGGEFEVESEMAECWPDAFSELSPKLVLDLVRLGTIFLVDVVGILTCPCRLVNFDLFFGDAAASAYERLREVDGSSCGGRC